MSQNDTATPSVLFVCLGNICRSPMAEGAFRAAAEKAGLDVRVDSVGTADYHIGAPPDPRAIAAARSHGVDISGLEGRQLAASDFREFTHIFALDLANLEGIRSREPRHSTAQVAMLLDAVPGQRGEAIIDPYHGDDAGFEACWQSIDEAVEALVARFAKDGAAARF
ncbi:MAG: low molecular weight protein-tyrosine-phosphatase [Erythrobacter sp.]